MIIAETKFETVMIVNSNKDKYASSRIFSKRNFGKKVLRYSCPVKALIYLADNLENIATLPQVIFLDTEMPTMSKFGFMKVYNKLSSTFQKNCRVVALSTTIDNIDPFYNDEIIFGS